MKIIGHRGARELALENTIEAIQAGLDAGVDMIEIDVRLDDSNIVVLAHDLVLSDVDYTTLQEVLDKVGTDFPINIEIKERDVAYKLKDVLADYTGDIVISSGSAKTLAIAHKEVPKAELAILEKWSSLRALYKARALKIKRVHMNQKFVLPSMVRFFKRRGYDLFVYTVNDVERARTLELWGVEGIFTDRPDMFTSNR